MHSKARIQKDTYSGSDFNTISAEKDSLKLVECKTKDIEGKDDSNMDFFLEDDPVYIGKYESEMFLNLNKSKKK